MIGRAEVISSVPVPDIAALPRRTATARTTWSLAAAGNIDHDVLVELAGAGARASRPAGGNGSVDPPPAAEARRAASTARTPSSTTSAWARPGWRADDERRFVLRVLDTILGGSTSSRLFQEIREKRGLAYAVYSYQSHYVDSGQTALYVGTRPENVARGLRGHRARARADPDRAASADAELERAKENVKGRTVLAMESPLARMNRLGSSLLMGVPLLTLDETLAKIDAVTLDDVSALAAELLAPERLCAAGVGGDEEVFRDAVGAVSPALAAA